MKAITMLDFRRRADQILQQVRKGKAFVLTYRGKAVARLQPMEEPVVSSDDPIYHLDELASDTAKPLSNDDMDRIVYGA